MILSETLIIALKASFPKGSGDQVTSPVISS